MALSCLETMKFDAALHKCSPVALYPDPSWLPSSLETHAKTAQGYILLSAIARWRRVAHIEADIIVFVPSRHHFLHLFDQGVLTVFIAR